MSDIEEFQKRRDALMRWTPDKSDDHPIEAVDLMGYILTASELMNDLLAEVERLRDEIGRLKRSNELAWSLTKEAGEYE